jgi:hypothetical protein
MDDGQTAVNKEAIKQFAEKVYADMAGAMATGMAYVGIKTGLRAWGRCVTELACS